MPDLKQFRLPDVGEGLVEADIISWKVAVGDVVKVNTVLVEIETAKSLVELPSPYAGVVSELLFPEGATVDVGTPIITVDVDPAGAAADPEAPPPLADDMVPTLPVDDMAPASPAGSATAEAAKGNGRTSNLVGYGPRTTEARRRPRKPSGGQSTPARELQTAFSTNRTVARPVAPPRPPQVVVPVPQQAVPGAMLPGVGTVPGPGLPPPARAQAKPPVRKLARDLGVDLATCAATGPGGSVTREDVLAVVAGREVLAAPDPDGVRRPARREERIPVRGVRKMTAEAVSRSAFTAPHVTEFITVDVTRTVKLVRRLEKDPVFEGVRVSPLLVVAKALLVAVGRNPHVNAAWDEAAQEIVVKRYVNLGIAAATPRGLVVPNIKDAEAMSLRELADALATLTATARAGRTQPAEMAGGTISITNVGVFGVDTGTPILNSGEAAILCFGVVRRQPWVHKGRVVPRWVTQLALSFDHRLVDGDLGSRFLSDVASVLRDPARAAVHGKWEPF